MMIPRLLSHQYQPSIINKILSNKLKIKILTSDFWLDGEPNYFTHSHKHDRELTERIPHPVGRKAKIQANKSGMERSVIATATTTPASANRNETPWINRSSN